MATWTVSVDNSAEAFFERVGPWAAAFYKANIDGSLAHATIPPGPDDNRLQMSDGSEQRLFFIRAEFGEQLMRFFDWLNRDEVEIALTRSEMLVWENPSRMTRTVLGGIASRDPRDRDVALFLARKLVKRATGAESVGFFPGT